MEDAHPNTETVCAASLRGECARCAPTTDRVADAATRVRKWMTAFATLGGVDQEVMHRANHEALLSSDLKLVLDALGRDR